MRLGVFGGSFDPVHYGHLLLAESCREQCALDEVWFMPAAVPPHKLTRDRTPARTRVEMLELAIAGYQPFRVSTVEVDRGGVSYTIDTLAEIRQRDPNAELFLLMGADSLLDLPTWRAHEEICALAIPVAVRRAGSPEPDFSQLEGVVPHDRLAAIRQHQVEMPVVGLSSSDIRRRRANGGSIRYHTPRAVEKYIETKDLYRES